MPFLNSLHWHVCMKFVQINDEKGVRSKECTAYMIDEKHGAVGYIQLTQKARGIYKKCMTTVGLESL